jgi:hypothetical protein
VDHPQPCRRGRWGGARPAARSSACGRGGAKEVAALPPSAGRPRPRHAPAAKARRPPAATPPPNPSLPPPPPPTPAQAACCCLSTWALCVASSSGAWATAPASRPCATASTCCSSRCAPRQRPRRRRPRPVPAQLARRPSVPPSLQHPYSLAAFPSPTPSHPCPPPQGLCLLLMPYVYMSLYAADKRHYTNDIGAGLYTPSTYYAAKSLASLPFMVINVLVGLGRGWGGGWGLGAGGGGSRAARRAPWPQCMHLFGLQRLRTRRRPSSHPCPPWNPTLSPPPPPSMHPPGVRLHGVRHDGHAAVCDGAVHQRSRQRAAVPRGAAGARHRPARPARLGRARWL